MTKSAHFLPMKTTFSAPQYAQLYIDNIVRLHGFDHGVQFTVQFWRVFQEALGTWLDLSTSFHPQMDRQFERTIQISEDIVKTCVLDSGGNWSSYLPLIEFSYNKNY